MRSAFCRNAEVASIIRAFPRRSSYITSLPFCCEDMSVRSGNVVVRDSMVWLTTLMEVQGNIGLSLRLVPAPKKEHLRFGNDIQVRRDYVCNARFFVSQRIIAKREAPP